ncbi:nuclear transport factor 2 family protein [Streptacidiphilus sp. N1-3]|uniref:Nuclear transport factor 2 family protein n=1 Tax=Streptacidiphilus alkalitolerans TaxID=3342712 RepID=A0ABV6WWI6_9ACTN
MSVTTLPAPVAAYLEAKQAHDSDALLAALTEDAVITDEGNEYRGSDAIRAWNEKASKAVGATYAVEDVAAVADRTVVAVEVAGNFPGSPVTLYFHFALRDDRIAALTILG